MFYFKSEVGADEIVAFVALRAKVYSLISITEKDGKKIIEILSKLKGVNKNAVDAIGMYFI